MDIVKPQDVPTVDRLNTIIKYINPQLNVAWSISQTYRIVWWAPPEISLTGHDEKVLVKRLVDCLTKNGWTVKVGQDNDYLVLAKTPEGIKDFKKNFWGPGYYLVVALEYWYIWAIIITSLYFLQLLLRN